MRMRFAYLRDADLEMCKPKIKSKIFCLKFLNYAFQGIEPRQCSGPPAIFSFGNVGEWSVQCFEIVFY